MTLFSEKILISNRCISGFMSNLIKKSWTDSTLKVIIHKLRGRVSLVEQTTIDCVPILSKKKSKIIFFFYNQYDVNFCSKAIIFLKQNLKFFVNKDMKKTPSKVAHN